MTYYTTVTATGEFDDVVAKVTTRLEEEGFGVLCDIDVTAKFEEKLGLDDYRRYRILGACNPPMARRGLDVERELGVLLPCNVIVYENDDGDTVVSAVDPHAMLSVVESEALDDIATDVSESFDRILASVATVDSEATK